MNWAGIVILVLLGIELLAAAHMHGKEKTGKYNFWIIFISASIGLALFYFAGLFN